MRIKATGRNNLAYIGTAIMAAALCLLPCACSQPAAHPTASAFITLPATGWLYDEPLQFTPEHRSNNAEITDSICNGTLTVAVCYDCSYPYSNLWLEVTYPDIKPGMKAEDDATKMIADTLQLTLANKYGTFNSGHGIGTDFQASKAIDHSVTHACGTPIKVRHIMRTDTLTGINRVGIFFTPLSSQH